VRGLPLREMLKKTKQRAKEGTNALKKKLKKKKGPGRKKKNVCPEALVKKKKHCKGK